MYEAIYNLKHNRKKGFTLVELIVVLVILAILLAILVPSMTGWITKAKEKQVLINARTVYLACQTVASEEYAKATPGYTAGTAIALTAAPTGTGLDKQVADLAALNSSVKWTGSFTVNASGQVSVFSYVQNGITISLNTTNNDLEKTAG